MTNSRLIKNEVAYYMFGYWVIRCWENITLWNTPGLNKESEGWGLLKDFSLEMKAIDQGFVYNKRRMHF